MNAREPILLTNVVLLDRRGVRGGRYQYIRPRVKEADVSLCIRCRFKRRCLRERPCDVLPSHVVHRQRRYDDTAEAWGPWNPPYTG
jgi:hypothetical protein